MTLSHIPAVTVTESKRTIIVEADDGYRLVASRQGDWPHWHFNEYDSTPPTRPAHFDLRRLVHFGLNRMEKAR